MSRLKTVHVTLTPRIAKLLDDEVASGRFANISEAVRNAAWKAFATDSEKQLEDAFAMLDASDAPAPDMATILSEIRAVRKSARKRRKVAQDA